MGLRGNASGLQLPRALAEEPDIILLDEPTSALDVSVQAETLNLLTDLREGHNLTYLMVSHDLLVISMCYRVAVMKDGEIVETLTVAALRALQAKHAYSRSLLNASII